MLETHPKQLEAEGQFVSASSGTTSDDVYIVPEYPSLTSQELPSHTEHMDHENQAHEAISHPATSQPLFHSPTLSFNEDSLPSGIPNRLLLSKSLVELQLLY